MPKVTRSQFEPQLNVGQETRTINLTEDEFEIAVAMCSDFLQGRLISIPGSGNPFLQILQGADLRIGQRAAAVFGKCGHRRAGTPLANRALEFGFGNHGQKQRIVERRGWAEFPLGSVTSGAILTEK